jgi:hypothetical protein
MPLYKYYIYNRPNRFFFEIGELFYKNPYSFFTRFALLLKRSNILGKNEFNDLQKRSEFLKGGAEPVNTQTNFINLIFCKIVYFMKRPWF